MVAASLVLALTPGPAYLGVRMWLPSAPPAAGSAVAAPQSLRRTFTDGFLVALLNPKTALFFAAFLPQFLSAGADPLLQTLALGVVFVAIACCTDVAYVLAAGLPAPRLRRAARSAVWGTRLAGASFVGLGLLAAAGTRPAR